MGVLILPTRVVHWTKAPLNELPNNICAIPRAVFNLDDCAPAPETSSSIDPDSTDLTASD